MNLNTKEWKPFAIGKVFKMLNGKGITQEEINENKGNLNAVQSGEENNGVIGKIDLDYCKQMNYNYTLKSCLTVARTGSAGFVSFQKDGCVVGDSAKILLLPDEVASIECYLFLQTILNVNRYKYTYGRKVTETKYLNDYIDLPPKKNSDGSLFIDKFKVYSDEGYVPDWIFMEKYIKSLKYRAITTANTKTNNIELKIDKWKEFKIGDIFPKRCVKHYSSTPEIKGNIPFITSTSSNNGIAAYVDEESIEGNCITVSTNGDCFDCFYQPSPIAISNDAEVLYNDNLNVYNAMFIISILRLEKIKYGYGRKPKNDKVYETYIKLPITPEENIDWIFMEEYIKSLPYGDKLK